MTTDADAHAYYAGLRPELKPFIPPHRRVLEVGCGRGGFRANLAPDAEVWGVEAVPEVAEQAGSVMTRVLTGRFEDVAADLPDRYFDLIVCNDVIEHMSDDRGFLQSLHRYMAPGAHLMGSIPNMRYWPVMRELIFRRDWEYQDEGVLDRTHLRFYTVRSFPRLLQQTGFALLRWQGINGKQRKFRQWMLRLILPRWSSDLFCLQFAFVATAESGAPGAARIQLPG